MWILENVKPSNQTAIEAHVHYVVPFLCDDLCAAYVVIYFAMWDLDFNNNNNNVYLKFECFKCASLLISELILGSDSPFFRKIPASQLSRYNAQHNKDITHHKSRDPGQFN